MGELTRWSPPGPAMLFCPGDRPERFDKAAERADAVIVDLEDAVAPDKKDAARKALRSSDLDPDRTVVRIGRLGTVDAQEDVTAVADTSYRVVMVAKAQDPQQISQVPGLVIAQIETPLGAWRVGEIAACHNVIGLAWGSEDLVAAMGGRTSRRGAGECDSGRYRDVPALVRANVRLAAAAFGKFAIDAIHADLDDDAGLRAEALDAAAQGFAASACIHPAQVPVIREAYRPSTDDLHWAQRVLNAAADDRGVLAVDGSMIDAPVVEQARAIMRFAD